MARTNIYKQHDRLGMILGGSRDGHIAAFMAYL